MLATPVSCSSLTLAPSSREETPCPAAHRIAAEPPFDAIRQVRSDLVSSVQRAAQRL